MIKKPLLLVFALSWAGAVQALPLKWTLNGVTFDDGGIATGSFVFDADANELVSWNVEVSGGNETDFPPFVYTRVAAPNQSVFDPEPILGTFMEISEDFQSSDPRFIVLHSDIPLTNDGGSVAFRDGIDFISEECRGICRDIVSGSFEAEPLPICNIQLNQDSFVNGETVVADVYRFANPGGTPLAVEIKIWIELPFFPLLTVTSAGDDGSLVFQPGDDLDLGPLPLFAVDAGLPRGRYEFSCRLRDPATSEILADDRNFFRLQ